VRQLVVRERSRALERYLDDRLFGLGPLAPLPRESERDRGDGEWTARIPDRTRGDPWCCLAKHRMGGRVARSARRVSTSRILLRYAAPEGRVRVR
jgi:hypothetical protein